MQDRWVRETFEGCACVRGAVCVCVRGGRCVCVCVRGAVCVCEGGGVCVCVCVWWPECTGQQVEGAHVRTWCGGLDGQAMYAIPL